jgi:hypothetical protein
MAVKIDTRKTVGTLQFDRSKNMNWLDLFGTVVLDVAGKFPFWLGRFSKTHICR